MTDIKIKLKSARNQSVVFAEGPNGEILFIQEFPGLPVDDMRKFRERRDAILEQNHHLQYPDQYQLIKEVSSSEGEMMMGLPKLTGMDLAKHDLRRGIQVVSAEAMKEIKG